MARGKAAAANDATQTDTSAAATAVLDPPACEHQSDPEFVNQPFVIMVKRGTVEAHGGELIATAEVPDGRKWDITFHGDEDWRVTATKPDGTTDEERHVQFRRAWNKMTDAWRFFSYHWWSDKAAT